MRVRSQRPAYQPTGLQRMPKPSAPPDERARISRSFTIPRHLYDEARDLSRRKGPYTPSVTAMLERGLELAVAEQKGQIRIEKVGDQ